MSGWNRLSAMQKFQSTLPVRGATALRLCENSMHKDFNPRSPCGERRQKPYAKLRGLLFQSTLPVRGATAKTLC